MIILIMSSHFRLGLPSSISPGSESKRMSSVHVLHSMSIHSFISSPSQYLLKYKLWILSNKKLIQFLFLPYKSRYSFLTSYI